jgi:hypothetical protein
MQTIVTLPDNTYDIHEDAYGTTDNEGEVTVCYASGDFIDGVIQVYEHGEWKAVTVTP